MEQFSILILAISLSLCLFALRAIPMTFTKKAAAEVIRIFREHEAVGVFNAKSANDLGLGPTSLIDRLIRSRDYRSMALSVLTKSRVIHQTGDGKYYLSEDGLHDYCRTDQQDRLGICGGSPGRR